MEFFETPEQVAQQLEEARLKLERFGEDATNTELFRRLGTKHRLHPSLVLRRVFMLATIASFAGTVLILALPFLGVSSPSTVGAIRHLEQVTFGAPLPVVALICTFCMSIAWITASQAALAVARECELLPEEQKQHDRLLGEFTRLSGQKAIMERLKGTPMGANPRIATPVAASRRAARPSLTADQPQTGAPADVEAARVPFHTQTPQPVLRVPTGYTNPGAPQRASGAGRGSLLQRAVMGRERAMPTPDRLPASLQTRGGTPLGAPVQAKAVPIGGRPALGSAPEPVEQPHEGAATASISPDDLYQDVPDIVDQGASQYIIGSDTHDTKRFSSRCSTEFPTWGQVTEPWLEDAIEKAELLARAFPVQAHLEFSREDGLPFGLVLERATPAMAVRCTMQYVEFLASIAIPPRARVEFRSVAHMDPSFYRNVISSLEPYFGDAVEVTRDTRHKRVDVDFLDPDIGWTDYPRLPILT